MRALIDRPALVASVDYAVRAVPSRPTEPIYSGVLLEADGDSLRVSGYDAGAGFTAAATTAAQIPTAGRVLVSGRLLNDIVKTLPGDQVDLTVDGDRLRVVSGKAKFALPLMPTGDYPELPKVPDMIGVLPVADFAAAVAQVAFAAAGPDAALPILSGVRVEFSGRTIVLTATDRYRVATRVVSYEPMSEDFTAEVTIPAKMLADSVKGMLKDGGNLTLSYSGTVVGLATDRKAATLGLVDGDYPKWRSLFPSTSAAVATLDAGAFSESIGRVSLVRAPNEPVKLAFGSDQLTISASEDAKAEGEEDLTVSYAGEAMTVGFNPTFLREGITGAGAGSVQLAMTTAVRPIVITAAGDDAEAYRYLVMPVKLKS